MFKVKAYVTEIEPHGLYGVDIDGFRTVVASCVGVDDGVVTFKSALVSVLELNYGDCGFDFDFLCCGVRDGVACYVVSIYDYAW